MAIADDPGTLRTNALKVAVTLCLTYTLCFFIVGVWLRVRSRTYGRDDVLAMVATTLSLGQFATQYVALSNDLGRTSTFLYTSPNVDTLNKSSKAGVILFVLTLYASKASSVALTSRFAKQKRHITTIYAVLGLITFVGVATLLELNIECGLTGRFYWRIVRNSDQCPSQYLRFQIATAFDIITEILILILPIDIIWSLQMRTKAKMSVLARFWVRVPVIALSAARHYYISRSLSASTDAGQNAVYITLFQELEMAYSLSVATIITLRPFAKDFYTGFGLGGETVAHFGTTHPASYGGGTSGSNGASRFVTSAKGGSQVTSGNHGGVRYAGGGKASYVLGTRVETEPKESEEYILQERPGDSKIYKHTTYTVSTQERSTADSDEGGDVEAGGREERRSPGPQMGRAL